MLDFDGIAAHSASRCHRRIPAKAFAPAIRARMKLLRNMRATAQRMHYPARWSRLQQNKLDHAATFLYTAPVAVNFIVGNTS